MRDSGSLLISFEYRRHVKSQCSPSSWLIIAEAEPWHQTSLFQTEDGTEGARKEYAFYCGKRDHAFGEAG